MKSRVTKLATAAVIIIAVLIGISTFSGTSAWAQIVQALNEVENVHIIAKITTANGEQREGQWYLKKPCFLREESVEVTVIDDGKNRVTLNKREKTSQLADSFAPWKPISKHYMFHTLGLFRNEYSEGYELTKLAKESSQTILVYSLRYKQLFKGKAWVQADTMLPLRIAVSLLREPEPNEVVAGEITFNYEPIPVETFSMTIPADYRELPRKERGILSGKVIDEQDNPVVGAVVYTVDRASQFVTNGLTDEQGNFSFQLPPEGAGLRVWLPIFLGAFQEHDPGWVAWTIITNPDKARELHVRIPGEVGHIKTDGPLLKGASGVVLRMEPAGKISGQITDMEGNPVVDAQVSVTCNLVDKFGNEVMDIGNLGEPGERRTVRCQTDEQGRYEFNNLPRFWDKTVFILSAAARGYVSKDIRFRSKGPMDYKEVDFQLHRAALVVTGTVVDNYGEPLADREVFVTVNGKDYRMCRTETDENGRFKLIGCPITEDLQIKAELSHNHWPPHEKERYMSYRYYPDVIVGINYEEGKTEYEVELVAERPEITIEVELKNTAGEPLPYFPIGVRGAPGSISSQWKADKKLKQRTDKQGYCKFTEVPNVEDLRIVMWGGSDVWNDPLSKEEAKKIRKEYEKYKWTEAPIEVAPRKKEYKVKVTLLTNEEDKCKKQGQ